MRVTLVLDGVGLSPGLLGEHTPNLSRLAARGGMRAIALAFPALTCPVQSSFVTGTPPRDHGIVGNGWYFRDLAEIRFWHQSDRLVAGPKLWETAKRRDPAFTCAKLFWWYNMYSAADFSVTPRPVYTADGRKIPDIYTNPPALREELTARLGPFPLFRFWGPAAGIESSAWIRDCALHVMKTRKPTLTLVYLPHLDYGLQRRGPTQVAIAADLAAVDAVCGELIEAAEGQGARIVVLSEYGIGLVSRPVFINRCLRQAGLLRLREERGGELLDAGASPAFAVCDHQIAHIHVASRERVGEVKALVESLPGVERVLDEEGKRELKIDHSRAGDLVAVADAASWFAYYYWLDDAHAPDFARTVDIHRKPGYDPVELFLDPALRFPKMAIGRRLAQRALGLRTLLDVIPLTPELVRGSHGRLPDCADKGPLFLTSEPDLLPEGPAAAPIEATAIHDLILDHLFGP
jgi:predicted AlkP superfamily pyrophosphatase or phosphodiesterase